jgi:hypothetical protein
MYTIRPCSAGVIGFDGPHAEIAIANTVANIPPIACEVRDERIGTAMFDLIGWPGIDCTDEWRDNSALQNSSEGFFSRKPCASIRAAPRTRPPLFLLSE